MCSVAAYIAQLLEKPVYGPFLYQPAAVVAGTLFARRDLKNESIKYTYVNSISISVPAVGPGTFTLTDVVTGQVIITLDLVPNVSGYYPFTIINKGSLMQIASSVAAGIIFTVGLQYIYDGKENGKQ